MQGEVKKMHETIQLIFEAILAGETEEVEVNVRAALDAGLDPDLVLNEGMIAAMREVGARFEAGDFYVPEMLISARAMQGGMGLLKPLLKQKEVQSGGRVVIELCSLKATLYTPNRLIKAITTPSKNTY